MSNYREFPIKRFLISSVGGAICAGAVYGIHFEYNLHGGQFEPLRWYWYCLFGLFMFFNLNRGDSGDYDGGPRY